MEDKNNIGIVKIHSNKFKTNIVSVMFRTRLKRELASKNALLLKYLVLGSKKYLDVCDIERKCQEMYGSVFSADIIKKGAEQILFFYMEVPEIRGKRNKLMKEASEFLSEIIFNPAAEEGSFNEERLSLVKTALKDDISSLKDDKRYYAFERLKEEMFKGESYGVSGDGYEEDIDKITAEELMEHYKILIEKAPMEIMFSGNLAGISVKKYADKYFNINRESKVILDEYEVHEPRFDTNFVKEDMEVSQGRFCAGYASGLERTSKNIASGKVLSEVLGGTGNGKIYENIREKEGLAYYVSSSFSPYSMCMFIEAGIGNECEKTAEIIKNEVDSIRCGKVSKEDIRTAKKEIIKNLLSISDSKQSLMDFVLQSIVLKRKPDIKEEINALKSVKTNDVIRFARSLEADTIYFLAEGRDLNDLHN